MISTIKYFLPLFSLFGIYAIFIFSSRNGLFALLDDAIVSRTMPGGGRIKTALTGIRALDENLLIHLNAFFLRVVDGSAPGLSLYALGFAGSFAAAWALISLEGWRKGNAWTVVGFPFIFGFLAQTITYAISIPLFCALHLWTSTTARNPSFHSITVPRSVSNALPLLLIVGHLVPTVILALPTLSMDTKQSVLAAWQPWPLYVSFLTTVSKWLFSRYVPSDGKDDRTSIHALRRVYAFSFACAAIPHIAAWSVSLASVSYPNLFNADYLDSLHPRRVFVNKLPWASRSVRVSSIEEGSLWFLQWDYTIGSMGLLLWAATLYVNAYREVGLKVSPIGLGLKICLLVMCAGPVGAAVELMWERDELVLGKRDGEEEARKGGVNVKKIQ